MKKIFLAVALACLMSSSCYGAASDDVYVRQDVFDAKMEALFNRLDGRINALSEQMEKNFANLRTEISNFKTEVKTEFGEVRGDIKALNARMYGFEKQVEYFGNFPYWMLVLFGAILLLPFFNIKALQYTKTKNKIQEEKFLCCR
ncbi:MAG: hypothetical protein IJP53_01105 [Synergistaceae bacterium]|nr:hypothetical protein [Synergistaceae bacterium]